MTIKLSTQGKAFAKPDKLILNYDFSIKRNTYDDVIMDGTTTIENFINYLTNIKGKFLSKDNIHTNGFSIREVYKDIATGEKDGYGRDITKKEFDFYNYSQSVKVEMDYNLDFLSILVKDMSNKESYIPSFRVSFGLKDEEALKDLALEDAYRKCFRKAEILAKVSGRTLGECKEITHNIDFGNSMIYRCSMNSYEMEESFERKIDLSKVLNPENIEVTADIVCTFKAKDSKVQ
jgi:uncharacterized protein YggE